MDLVIAHHLGKGEASNLGGLGHAIRDVFAKAHAAPP
jgi:hypothetical protein